LQAASARRPTISCRWLGERTPIAIGVVALTIVLLVVRYVLAISTGSGGSIVVESAPGIGTVVVGTVPIRGGSA
jgi:hypothetical protein